METIDIYRSAQLILSQYGDKALIEIKNRIDALLAKQDKEGAAIWYQIADAVHWMQEEKEKSTCH